MNNITLTILSWVSVFIIWQYIIEFVIKPRKEFLKVLNEIRFSIIFYSNKLGNYSKDKMSKAELWEYEEIELEIRKLASKLHSNFFDQFIINKLWQKVKVDKIVWLLIWISNTGYKGSFKAKLKYLQELKEIIN